MGNDTPSSPNQREQADKGEYDFSTVNGDASYEADVERLQGLRPPRTVTDADPLVDEEQEHKLALPPHVRAELGLDDDADEDKKSDRVAAQEQAKRSRNLLRYGSEDGPRGDKSASNDSGSKPKAAKASDATA